LNKARNLAKKKIPIHGIFPNDDFERILRILPFYDKNLKQASMDKSFRYSNLNYGEFMKSLYIQLLLRFKQKEMWGWGKITWLSMPIFHFFSFEPIFWFDLYQ